MSVKPTLSVIQLSSIKLPLLTLAVKQTGILMVNKNKLWTRGISANMVLKTKSGKINIHQKTTVNFSAFLPVMAVKTKSG